MGYITYFNLAMIGDDTEIEKVKEAAKALNTNDEENGYAYEGIQELVKDGCLEAKWYDFEEDFIPWAKQFPNVLFIVDGDGEESNDIWELRVKGNIMEYHQVEMPPFTTKELLTPYELEHKNNN